MDQYHHSTRSNPSRVELRNPFERLDKACLAGDVNLVLSDRGQFDTQHGSAICRAYAHHAANRGGRCEATAHLAARLSPNYPVVVSGRIWSRIARDHPLNVVEVVAEAGFGNRPQFMTLPGGQGLR